MIRLSFLACLVLATGCQPEATGERDLLPPPDSLQVVPEELTLDAEPVEGAEETARVARLVSVVPQDDTCFLMAEEGGQQALIMATPEACAMAAPLEGQPVILTEGQTQVQAADCAEGEDCPDGGTAPLVVSVTAVE
ncbi:MAG: hypothetical protein AAFQ43_13740 [Bacteroidota bacterium]